MPGGRQRGGERDDDAAAGQADREAPAVEQGGEGGAAEQRADPPGGVEIADAAVVEVEQVEGEDHDQHLGGALEEDDDDEQRPEQAQARVLEQAAEAERRLAQEAGELAVGHVAGALVAPIVVSPIVVRKATTAPTREDRRGFGDSQQDAGRQARRAGSRRCPSRCG